MRYSPFAATEKITLGILFFEEQKNYRMFKVLADFDKWPNIADDVPVEMLKKLLYGIKEEAESKIYQTKTFDIEDYIRFYLNAFRFDGVQTVKYDDLDKSIMEIVQSSLDEW